jgi:hypothetical protein
VSEADTEHKTLRRTRPGTARLVKVRLVTARLVTARARIVTPRLVNVTVKYTPSHGTPSPDSRYA